MAKFIKNIAFLLFDISFRIARNASPFLQNRFQTRCGRKLPRTLPPTTQRNIEECSGKEKVKNDWLKKGIYGSV